MNREQAIELARKHAKAKPQSYYAEPFQPHVWVIDAVLDASNSLRGEIARLMIAMQWIVERCDGDQHAVVPSIRAAASTAIFQVAQPAAEPRTCVGPADREQPCAYCGSPAGEPCRAFPPPAIDEATGLRGCPFCGGRASHTIGSAKPPAHYVMCTNADCNATTAMRAVAADAAQDWNRRPEGTP